MCTFRYWLDCKCKDKFNADGSPYRGGNCKSGWCYVLQPAHCGDAMNSTIANEMWSYDACGL